MIELDGIGCPTRWHFAVIVWRQLPVRQPQRVGIAGSGGDLHSIVGILFFLMIGSGRLPKTAAKQKS